MTNFDFLQSDPQFTPFADAAIAAERILPIDPSACMLNCRRAMEFAVKWMYSVDDGLVTPYQDNLVSLMSTEDFRQIVDDGLWRRMDFIRRAGNNAAHSGKKVTAEQAELCLENLYIFWTLWPTATAQTMPRGTLTSPFCPSSPKAPPLPWCPNWILTPFWRKTRRSKKN